MTTAERRELYHLADTFATENRLEEAIALFDHIHTEYPGDVHVMARLADLNWRHGRRDRPFALYQKITEIFIAAGQLSKAEAVVAIAAQARDHEDPQQLEWCARTAARIGCVDRADSWLCTLMALYRERGAPDDVERVYRLLYRDQPPECAAGLRLADNLEGEGRLEDAITIVEELFASSPDNVRLARRLATLCRQAGRRGEAFAWYRKATACLIAAGQLGDAFAVSEMVRNQRPIEPDELEWCATTNLLLGRFERGERYYCDLIALYEERRAWGDADRIRRLLDHLDPPDPGMM